MHIAHLSTLFSLAIGANSIPTAARPQKPIYLPKRLIALEEHVVSPSLEAEVVAAGLARQTPGILEKMKDVGAGRLAAMDAGHVSMQVLAQQSASGLEDAAGCRSANDAIYTAIQANPTRFAGFAVLPMALPDEAAAELNRSVTSLGFKGAMIWNHLHDGTYYDGSRFDPVFAMAQALDVPLYLHPAPPSALLAEKLYAGNYPADVAGRLGTISWGWHIDVGTHVLRLFSAGLFDRFPRLKLILGHDGEGLPLFIDRVDATQLRQNASFNHVWNTNIWSTTSGLFTLRQFEQLRQVSPIERIMYSVDYPFGDPAEGWEFVGNLSKEGVLGEREMDLFAWGNAERLLRL